MNLKSGNEPVPVQIARTTIEVYIRERRIVTTDEVPPFGENPAGCFVSIHAHGSLRGCIGTILPTKETVAAEIIRNAVSASTEDPRFDAVRSEELEELDISVDILSEPEPVRSTDELDPEKYGVIVTSGIRRGLLLPALDGVDTVYDQLAIARRKGGIAPDEQCAIQRFTVVRYS